MCGIVGLINNLEEETKLEDIKKMGKAIHHRGPDDEGYYANKQIAFGMTRLSIIDLSNGHQPIWSDDKQYAIVFNGEIYNYKELRENLIKDNFNFNTHSDTEVILNLYIRDGEEFVNCLNGMFSIFIYDVKKDIFLLYRDRVGIKPVYYFQDEENFVFASELKSIFALSEKINFQINKQAIYDYTTLRYSPMPNTVWKDIKKLLPGSYIKYNLDDNKYETVKYWNYSFIAKKRSLKKNYMQEFSTILQDSIEKRILASDVPVGVALSGGIDSSIIATTAVDLGHSNFHTFSVGFDNDYGQNELKYAAKVANEIKSNHHEIIVTKDDFIDFLPDFVYYSDEPLADLASVPLYFLSKRAKQNVKVLLSGEGADELFAGYTFNKLDNRFKKINKLAKILPYVKPMIGLSPLKSKYIFKTLLSNDVSEILKLEQYHMTKYWNDIEKRELFKNAKSYEKTENFIDGLYKQIKSKHHIDQVLDIYCRSWLVDDLLMKADKFSMAASLELRVPFLDHRMVEFATSLPNEYKIKNNKTKYILREYAKSKISSEIINRPKKGFSIPVYEWIKNDLYDWARELIYTSDSLKSILHIEKTNKEFELIKDGDNQSAHKIWSLIILHYWMKRWM